MFKGKLFCVGVFPILLCSLALLLLTLAIEWRDIELKVKRSAENALTHSKHSWVKIETFNRGRQVLVTGTAPNQEAVLSAIAQIEKADGVLDVTHNGEPLAPAPTKPARLNAKLMGGVLTINGTLSSQSEIDELIKRAEKHFGEKNVVNRLQGGPNIQMMSAPNVLAALFVDPNSRENLSLSLNGSELVLSGTANTQDSFDHISKMTRNYKGPVANTVRLEIPTPKVNCETVFADLMVSTKINFTTAKADVLPSSFELLDQIASTAEHCPDSQFNVMGHTDASGSERFNLQLSQRRAQSVIDYLVQKGRPKQQFSAIGLGSAEPIASNDTPEGRTANRRIEFKMQK